MVASSSSSVVVYKKQEANLFGGFAFTAFVEGFRLDLALRVCGSNTQP